MASKDAKLQKLLEEHQRLAESSLQWALWRLSRKESGTKNFSKDEPDPSPQILKLFVEFYITT
ncbi:hypothetical protein GB937_007467 [Aspergillus fischeri]|nr:hypothetical protein GB937_007467 [Aspergillus fischeri]